MPYLESERAGDTERECGETDLDTDGDLLQNRPNKLNLNIE